MSSAPRALALAALLGAFALGCGESTQSHHGAAGGAGSGGGAPACNPPHFVDPALEQAVRTATGGDLSQESVAALTKLTATRAGITELAGLECATGLEDTVDLTGNAIAGLTPLGSLTRLERLLVGGNPLGDLHALASLGALTELAVNDSPIADLSPLTTLGALESLNVARAPVASFEALASVRALRVLLAPQVKATSLAPLAGLGLQSLNVAGAPLTDFEVLAHLKELENLDISSTGAQSLAPLAGLTLLEELVASDNAVTDVAALTPLPALRVVRLDGNGIAELDPLLQAAWPSGVELTVTRNPLSAHALNDVVPVLCSRGYKVTTDGPSCGPPPR